VSIHEEKSGDKNFGQVQNAFVRIVKCPKPIREAVRYDLVEDWPVETALIMAELYRKGRGVAAKMPSDLVIKVESITRTVI